MNENLRPEQGFKQQITEYLDKLIVEAAAGNKPDASPQALRQMQIDKVLELRLPLKIAWGQQPQIHVRAAYRIEDIAAILNHVAEQAAKLRKNAKDICFEVAQ